MKKDGCALLAVAMRERGWRAEEAVAGRLYARFDLTGESSKKDRRPGVGVRMLDMLPEREC